MAAALPKPETVEEFLALVPETVRDTVRAELLAAAGQGAATWRVAGRPPRQTTFLGRTAGRDD